MPQPFSECQRTSKPSKHRIRKSLLLEEKVAEHSEVGCGVGCDSTRKKACVARCFDLLRKSNSNVPSYADEFDLFVFGASLTSLPQ